MGELAFFLGLQVLQKNDGIFILQDKYVGDILKKFRYTDVRTAKTPIDKENPWGKDGPGKDMDLHLYRSMFRSLMYLIASRLDIMFAVCVCARHQVTPKECHLHAVKRIFSRLLWPPSQLKQNMWQLQVAVDKFFGFKISYWTMDNNVADLLTKPFDVGIFQYLVVSIGMLNP
ncbi:hypothetical protein Tco_0030074 [Tanacetum coccineum]